MKEKQTARGIHENTQRQDNPEWRVTVQIMEFGALFFRGLLYAIILQVDAP